MIVVSDNTATNMLIDELGMDAVNRDLNRLGLPNTRLRRNMIRPVRDPVPGTIRIAFRPGGIEGVTTVWALVDLPRRPYALSVMTTCGGNGGGTTTLPASPA